VRKSSTFSLYFSITPLSTIPILRAQAISFGLPVNIPHAANTFATDVNRDGNTDLIFFDGMPEICADGHVTGFSVAIGNGNGTFQPSRKTQIGNGAGIRAFAFGDFNRDGKTDVAVLIPTTDWQPSCSSEGTSLQIFLGTSSGNLQVNVALDVLCMARRSRECWRRRESTAMTD
jgi:hypothetical protein